MMPMTNSQIAAANRETARKYGTQSNGTGLGECSQSYDFGSYQVVWQGENLAEVRDLPNGGRVVYRGTKAECVAWAKAQ